MRVLAADGNPLFRDGLVRAIRERPELELVAEASEGNDALEAILALRPDVAIVDQALPELDGVAIVAAVRRNCEDVRVVLVADRPDGAVAFKAIGAGAAGYLTKDATRDQICDAISAAARGQVVMSPAIQRGIASEIRLRSEDVTPFLTKREREIIQFVAAGRKASEIGAELHLSTATIKTHLQHVYKKLGVSDRAAAVAEAMRRGLLE